jgi:hypothetical protein
MAIPYWSCYRYDTVLHADRDGAWAGIADDDGSESLVGRRPSVVVTNGRVTLTRRGDGSLDESQTARASFDGGEALQAVLREGDRLACWRGPTAEIGLSVTRAGSLVLGLGTLGHTPGGDFTVDHDPRVEERELAGEVRYIDRPGTHIVWLDPATPSELEAGLRELDGSFPGVNVLGIVVRSDDLAVQQEMNRRTMKHHRSGLGAAVFLTAAERFSTLDEWLQYGRSLSPERPRDLWLKVRRGDCECLVPEGTTATVDGWLVHVFRVYEPGIPGKWSQLGLVSADAGVTAAMLARSSALIDDGLAVDRD